jgi:4a-hydroxytetrahydrobiopterin dehydratase
MTEALRTKRCIPCSGDVPPLDPVAATELLRQLPAWRIGDGETPRLTRRFTFPDFRAALAWVNRVGALAEDEAHHPDIAIHYNVVELEIWTHAIRGLSESDFVLAAKIDALTEA